MKKYVKLLIPLSLIAAVYIIFHIVGIGCPIKFVTGISCPGCGMSRACLWLLVLDFSTAFYFHPLFWAVPLFPILYILRETKILPKKPYDIAIIVICSLFIIVWLWRMFSGSDIVVFEPQNGIVGRLIEIFTHIIEENPFEKGFSSNSFPKTFSLNLSPIG